MLTRFTRTCAQAALLGTTLAFCNAFAADPPKEEEVPFWAVGKPKAEAGAKMAPVPSFPIPTAVDQLPLKKLKVPPGFKVEVWASNILDARGLRQGDKGTVFVSSLFVAGKIYAVVDKGGQREVKTIAEKLFLPNGIEYVELQLATGQVGMYLVPINTHLAASEMDYIVADSGASLVVAIIGARPMHKM